MNPCSPRTSQTTGLGRSAQLPLLRWPSSTASSTLRCMTSCSTHSGRFRTRCIAPLALLALVGLPLSGCSGRAAQGADAISPSSTSARSSNSVLTPVPPTAGSVPPSTDPAPTAPVTTSTALPPVDAVAGLLGIQQRVNDCLTLPAQCEVSTIAVEGSQAHRLLSDLVHYYLSNALVARIIPAVTYVVPERVRQLGPTLAEITLCEVDGSWQMDSRRTLRTEDDIVWNDGLVSRRAKHVIELADGVWRRVEISELQFWPGENRCPRPTAV